jgi:hypothetical protein
MLPLRTGHKAYLPAPSTAPAGLLDGLVAAAAGEVGVGASAPLQ